MTRLSPSSRAHIKTCAYMFVAVSVIGGAFVTTTALMQGQNGSEKIGPGYARMQPVHLGKPEKVAYSTPYYPHVASSTVSRTKQPVPPTIAAPLTLPPMMSAEATRFSPTDIHRIY
jgi:hypothetical protein